MKQITASEGDIQFVTLGIDREVFAIPVEAVLEILDMKPTCRLPDAPAYVDGLIDVRGRAVPVIDLRTKLGLRPKETTENTRILVLEITAAGRNLVLGLIADKVFEVAAFGAGQIEPAPDIGIAWNSEYILGVARREAGFVIIFDLARLFSEADVARISGSEHPIGLGIAAEGESNPGLSVPEADLARASTIESSLEGGA